MSVYYYLKSKVPHPIRKVMWYIVKSPQREHGFVTVFIEVYGFIQLIFRKVYFKLFKPELKPISICTGLKNRTSNYLDSVFDSILKMNYQELIEISIFDCGSDDFKELESQIKLKWKGNLKIHSENTLFTRSFSFNKAINQSSNQLFFVSDADMSLPKDLVKLTNLYVFKKNVWFPVCYKLEKDKPEKIEQGNGQWYPVGKGMFASKKEIFHKIGQFDESFTSWGGEDWNIWHRFYQFGYFPYRNRQKGLFHHWHISVKKEKRN